MRGLAPDVGCYTRSTLAATATDRFTAFDIFYSITIAFKVISIGVQLEWPRAIYVDHTD